MGHNRFNGLHDFECVLEAASAKTVETVGTLFRSTLTLLKQGVNERGAVKAMRSR